MASKMMVGGLLIATGCSMAPKYQRPSAPVPTTLPAGTAAGAAAGTGQDAAPDLRWQDYFTDPGMQAVIQLAIANNRDLRIAALNVEKMQALYRIQRSDLLPDLGVMASGNKYRLPEKMNNGTAKIMETDSVQVGLMAWELDFFGRIQSLKSRALNQYLATEQAHTAARISLVATVAQGYLVYAADQENLRLAEGTFEAQKTYFDMISQSNAQGIASELDLRQAQRQMEAARGDVARFRGRVAVDLNALELLAGTSIPAASLPKGLDSLGDLKDVSAGLASDVLLRRPDIQAGEYQLQAANANIGAARAAFFPRVSLTAGIGTMSPDVSGLFTSGTRTWSFAPQIVAPIFAGGSLWANLKISKVDREIALAQYEKAIQSAFREVADGLAQRTSLVEQLEAQRALVQALESTHRLSELRYKEGLDGYLGVLIAQRSLYGAQQGLVATRLARQSNQISLYKALAGSM
jgi:multidrug efflux system outer membrane protein